MACSEVSLKAFNKREVCDFLEIHVEIIEGLH